jgi:serine protease inhibitor
MHQSEGMPYAAGDGWQAVELAYEGGRQSMLILLPAEGQFEAFEASLNAARLDEILNAMEWTDRGAGAAPNSRSKRNTSWIALAELGMPRLSTPIGLISLV